MDATLSLGSKSVDIPLLDESGSPLVSSDLGKPEVDLRNTGNFFPLPQDQWSGLQNITLRGHFTGSNAYDKAITLVEIIEDDWKDNEMRLDIPLDEYDDNILVAPSAGSDQAVALDYQPGRRNLVVVDLSLTRVGRIVGTAERTITTPTATGNGPIELRALGKTVEISTDVTINRTAGRPKDTIRREPGVSYPYYINKHKGVSETISLEFLLHNDPIQDLENIGEIFTTQLGRRGVTLDFNGLYGLGAFNVLPTGSAPFRQARRAGYEGMSTIPTFDFTRVTPSP